MSETKASTEDVKKQMETVETTTTAVRNDVTGLTTKIYNIKTSLFEQTNELASYKATASQLQVWGQFNGAPNFCFLDLSDFL
jgi:hypothetical protein